MAIAEPKPATAFDTLGDVIEALPGIAPSRIRITPAPGTATEADVVRVRHEERRLCELVDGILVEKSMGYEESIIACQIIVVLGNFIRQHDLGVIAGEGGMLRLGQGLVRIPDVSFVSWDQLPGRQFPNEPVWGVHPDLAVEVLSASNTRQEIDTKIREYFASGTRLVWIVDLPTRSVRAYTAPDQSRTYGPTETLDGSDVLPGLQLEVASIFPAG
jgi:Uma2 family endonuclease